MVDVEAETLQVFFTFTNNPGTWGFFSPSIIRALVWIKNLRSSLNIIFRIIIRLCLCWNWAYADKIEFDVFNSLQIYIYLLYIFKAWNKANKCLGDQNYYNTAQTDQNFSGNFSDLNFQWQFRSLWFSPFSFLIWSQPNTYS